MRLHRMLLAASCVLSAASAQYVEKLISVPAGVYSMRYDSVDNRVFCSSGDTNVLAIDGAADSIVASFRVPGQPDSMCYDAQDDRLYWADVDSNLVRGMNAATYQLVARVRLSLPPVLVEWNPADDRLYCGCTNDTLYEVQVVDCAAESLVAAIPMDQYVGEFCFDTRDNKVYSTVAPAHEVQVIDAARDSIVATIPSNDPVCICYNPQMNRVYWGDGTIGDSVTVLDCAADTLVGRLHMGYSAFSSCWNPHNNKVYFGAYASNSVTVIDCAANQTLAILPVHGIPWKLCYDQHTNAVYSIDRDTMNVTVIDGTADSIVKNLPPHGVPGCIVFNPTEGRIYVGNEADYVTVIRDSGTGGIEETAKTKVYTANPVPTIVRGVLWLAPATNRRPQASSWLLDIAGRKVLDLHPGANDVSRLVPGVYFVCSKPSAVTKVVVSR